MGLEINATALFAEAMRLAKLGQLASAESVLQQCVDQMPGSSMLLGNLAAMQIMQRKYQEARGTLKRVLTLDPALAEAWLNLGIVDEEELADYPAALVNFDAAIKLRGNYPEAHYNRGNTLARMNRLDEAIVSYQRALGVAPDYVDALHNLANTYRSARQPKLALDAFNAAIKIAPSADLYVNRGYALRDIGQFEVAIKSFDKALQLDPAAPSCRGIKLHTKAQIGDWSNWAGQIEELAERIDRGETASPPFCVLHLLDSGPLQQQIAVRWTALNHPEDDALGAPAVRSRITPHAAWNAISNTTSKAPAKVGERLRIGYFSADFKDHPVAKFLINVLAHHDKSRFESIGFSFGADAADDMRVRLEEAFDQFHEVSSLSDRAIASLAREVGIDIAVDLSGYTGHGRPGIFALRAAPIQVNYLGHPGTMGAPYFDYLMADRITVPPQHLDWYSEKIVSLPNLYTNAYSNAEVSSTLTRRDYQLPDSSVVFCCINNSWKIDPVMFSSWMHILKSSGDSVLFLLGSHPLLISNLRREANKAGVDPKRLVFGTRVSQAEYLPRFRLADVFLDTFPYNAATTALDALFMGLPLITLCGTTYAARQAASVLASVGLPQLITTSAAEYQALAIELASDPARRAHLRRHLAEGASSSSAFDAPRYTRHIERAYWAMQLRLEAGLPADHLDINAAP